MSPKHPLIGQSAPVVSLPNADDTTYELKPGAEGKPTAVFFYPAAGTSPVFVLSLVLPVCVNVVPAGTYGCTREVCAFRDALSGASFPLIYVPQGTGLTEVSGRADGFI
jgi:peroxiredoxin Q/BCP